MAAIGKRSFQIDCCPPFFRRTGGKIGTFFVRFAHLSYVGFVIFWIISAKSEQKITFCELRFGEDIKTLQICVSTCVFYVLLLPYKIFYFLRKFPRSLIQRMHACSKRERDEHNFALRTIKHV